MSTIGVVAALTTVHAEHLSHFRIPPEMLEAAGVRECFIAQERTR